MQHWKVLVIVPSAVIGVSVPADNGRDIGVGGGAICCDSFGELFRDGEVREESLTRHVTPIDDVVNDEALLHWPAPVWDTLNSLLKFGNLVAITNLQSTTRVPAHGRVLMRRLRFRSERTRAFQHCAQACKDR
jgi:hypothetical protein